MHEIYKTEPIYKKVIAKYNQTCQNVTNSLKHAKSVPNTTKHANRTNCVKLAKNVSHYVNCILKHFQYIEKHINST